MTAIEIGTGTGTEIEIATETAIAVVTRTEIGTVIDIATGIEKETVKEKGIAIEDVSLTKKKPVYCLTDTIYSRTSSSTRP